MIDSRKVLVFVLAAFGVLAGCVEVRQPLAESEADGGAMEEDRGRDEMPDDGAAGQASDGTPVAGGGWQGMEPAPDWGTAGVGGDGTPVAGDGWQGMEPPPDWGTAGMGGDGSVMGGASAECGCDDGDACTHDYCLADGTCMHESFATMTDRDDDGVSDGCDCDDRNADVYPGQGAFFADPHEVVEMAGAAGAGGHDGSYDYDCDGYHMMMLTSEARPCEVYEGLDVCFGDGWLLSGGQAIPECGSGGAYQACEFREGGCSVTTLMMLQRCR